MQRFEIDLGIRNELDRVCYKNNNKNTYYFNGIFWHKFDEANKK